MERIPSNTSCNLVFDEYNSPLFPNGYGSESEEDEITLISQESISIKSSTITKTILIGALPNIIQLLSILLINSITLHYISLKNDVMLFNGISLALSIVGCFSFYLIYHGNVGFNSAVSQALVIGNTRIAGLYLHRAILIHFTVNIFTFGIIYAIPYLFGVFGMNKEILNISHQFLILCPGYIAGMIIFDTFKNYLFAHRIFNLVIVFQVIIAILYWFLCGLFFVKLGMHIKGIAIALTVSQGIGALGLMIYLCIWKPDPIQETLFFFNGESYKDLWPLAKSMMSMGVMGYMEVFSYKVQSFVAVYLAGEQMAALAAFCALGDLFYVFPDAISIPLSAFVASSMGSRNKIKLIKVIKVTSLISLLLLVLLVGAFYLLKNIIFSFYTQDNNIKEIMLQIGFIYLFTFPADFIQSFLAGIIKGIGKEKTGSKAFLIALYLVGLPLAIILGFVVRMQAVGMWLGNTVALYFATVLFICVICKTDFNSQFRIMARRIKGSPFASPPKVRDDD